MVVTLLATAGIVAVSSVVGLGVVSLCGVGRRWWAPAVGFATVLTLAAQIGRVPGRGTTIAVTVAVLCAIALARRDVREGLRSGLPDAGPLSAGVLAAAAIPFLVTGRWGILGVGVSNDMSAHLLVAYRLRTLAGSRPVGALGDDVLAEGYPIGPHGLVALLTHATGMGEVHAFSALTLAIPVITALAALGAIPVRPRLGRWAVGALTGLTFLAAAYLGQGAFKETIEGLVLLTAALAVADLIRERPRLRDGIPLGLLAAGAAAAYSAPGVLWPLGVGLAVVALEVVRHRREARSILRAGVVLGVGAGVSGLLAASPDLARMWRFGHSPFSAAPEGNKGNLYHALSPLETLGVWPGGDFRLEPHHGFLTYPLAGLALAALAAGLAWWWRRSALGPPAGYAVGVVAWLALAHERNVYAAAKALAVLAPVTALCIGAPLLAAWAGRATRGRVLARVVGVVLLVAAAGSSFAALRNAHVGLGSRAAELDRLRARVDGGRVLFLGVDHFAQWELRGTLVAGGSGFYMPRVLPLRPDKPLEADTPLDVDSFSSATLDEVDWVIAPAGAYQSTMPANLRLVSRTPSFRLYRRSGPTPPRAVLEPPDSAGAVLRCSTASDAGALRRFRAAAVRPRPVVVGQEAWRGRTVAPGESATLVARIPAGRWDVSLQYVSLTGLDLRGPHFRASLPPSLGRINSFWAAGTIDHPGGQLRLRAAARRLPALGRLVRAAPRTRAATSPHDLPLNRVAFTRHGRGVRIVPARRACGRWVDWYVPTTRGDLADRAG